MFLNDNASSEKLTMAQRLELWRANKTGVSPAVSKASIISTPNKFPIPDDSSKKGATNPNILIARRRTTSFSGSGQSVTTSSSTHTGGGFATLSSPCHSNQIQLSGSYSSSSSDTKKQRKSIYVQGHSSSSPQPTDEKRIKKDVFPSKEAKLLGSRNGLFPMPQNSSSVRSDINSENQNTNPNITEMELGVSNIAIIDDRSEDLLLHQQGVVTVPHFSSPKYSLSKASSENRNSIGNALLSPKFGISPKQLSQSDNKARRNSIIGSPLLRNDNERLSSPSFNATMILFEDKSGFELNAFAPVQSNNSNDEPQYSSRFQTAELEKNQLTNKYLEAIACNDQALESLRVMESKLSEAQSRAIMAAEEVLSYQFLTSVQEQKINELDSEVSKSRINHHEALSSKSKKHKSEVAKMQKEKQEYEERANAMMQQMTEQMAMLQKMAMSRIELLEQDLIRERRLNEEIQQENSSLKLCVIKAKGKMTSSQKTSAISDNEFYDSWHPDGEQCSNLKANTSGGKKEIRKSGRRCSSLFPVVNRRGGSNLLGNALHDDGDGKLLEIDEEEENGDSDEGGDTEIDDKDASMDTEEEWRGGL